MKRRALVIYCDNTESGELPGPAADNTNIREFLTSKLGGEWLPNEILSLNNPTIFGVRQAVRDFLSDCDYSFVVFSGHGFIDSHDQQQYVELIDGDIKISELVGNASRQTMIIDACRGFFTRAPQTGLMGIRAMSEKSSNNRSTRLLFDSLVKQCEEGISILYSADVNQSATDSDKGGAYLYSLIEVCRNWGKTNGGDHVLDIKSAHNAAIPFMKDNFITNQNPVMKDEKRLKYYPLAVKWTLL